MQKSQSTEGRNGEGSSVGHTLNKPVRLLRLLLFWCKSKQSRGPAEEKFNQTYTPRDPKGKRECVLCSLERFIDESLRAAGVINHTIKAGVYSDRVCDCQ